MPAVAVIVAKPFVNTAATTSNDVIARVGVSKRALYHHFRAKDDLLEELALRFAAQSLDAVADVLEQEGSNALEKLNTFFARSRPMKVETAPMIWPTFKALFRPENVVLYHRIRVALSEVMTPVLTRLIKEGMDEGVFDTPDAHGTASRAPCNSATWLFRSRAELTPVTSGSARESGRGRPQIRHSLLRCFRPSPLKIDILPDSR